MATLQRLLTNNELFLLFLTILLGLALGRLEWRGMKLGVAGVLFAGMGLSAYFGSPHKPLGLAVAVKELGLVLFVYSVGLTSAPGFFRSFRKSGVRFNVVALVTLVSTAALAWVFGNIWDLSPGLRAGLFAGALTNTPALGAAADRLAGTPFAADPVLAYSITYPFGVIGGFLAFRAYFNASERRRKSIADDGPVSLRPKIGNVSCRVTSPEILGRAIGELKIKTNHGVIVSRLKRDGTTIVPNKYTVFAAGDVVSLVGQPARLETTIQLLGESSPEDLEVHASGVDMRRILVSRRELVGKRIEDLNLSERFDAQVTRLRRADLDIIPTDDMRIELGDRLRVVAPHANLPEIGKYFGDSERELATVDFLVLALGLSLGLFVAKIPFTLFGTTLSLGNAGGPLIVALLVGWLGRTGSLVWSLPYESNTTLRELGILLFLAGVGVNAGAQLDRVSGGGALLLFGLGAALTLIATTISLVLLRKWAEASPISCLGATSGIQTQPANLAAAYELAGRTEEVYVSYALTYPVAMIGKILLAQVLATL